ncbi:26S protease regulatory subunit [Austwickia sp. TVS 96-490-7B]|uniref:ATP-binding protein n=1 Tax=Austwickia sp. TVS 96-490-7B TaxID=2830843 RepID=UPI0027154211|nr:ATP-binding protein [Austwickia sp. TVS 96-490-7B]
MSTSDPLIASLTAAVTAAPDDVPLRVHLAELLLAVGETGAAIGHAAAALQRDSGHSGAQRVMQAALGGGAGLGPAGMPMPTQGPMSAAPPPAHHAAAPPMMPQPPVMPSAQGQQVPPGMSMPPGQGMPPSGPMVQNTAMIQPGHPAPAAGMPPAAAAPPVPMSPPTSSMPKFISGPSPAAGPMGHSSPGTSPPVSAPPYWQERSAPYRPDTASYTGFDWSRAESEVADLAQPMFVNHAMTSHAVDNAAWDVESSAITLADVGGMEHVKERLHVAFLAPMHNPELRRLYGKSLRGGLLLYGPPGCGKTFVAKAVAGELGAKFISVGLSDVLDMWIGASERNLHDLFELARREAPVVIFLDEIDALGQKRASMLNTAMRTAVNQLLTELDGISGANDGVFVLAATNQPWDVDPALRRPGRLDRTVLVLPPDEPARRAIFHYHLKDRPVEGIDVGVLAAHTEGYSGADIAHICDSAAERALMDGVRSGAPRLIGMGDVMTALGEIRPSIGPWLDAARNVVEFSGADGMYDDLRAYLRAHRRR